MLGAMASPRIVSLVPSATETVFRLGAGDGLVGRSHACDFPPAATSRPALTRPRLGETSSRGIHDELRGLLARGLAIFDLDLEALRALGPTHLIVQDQCSVCAVAPSDLEAGLAEWLGEKPTLVSLSPHTLHDVWRDLETIGQAIGRGDRATALRRELATRLSELVERIGHPPQRPRVACLEWLDPPMIAGHWVPELVRLAGGEPLLGRSGGASLTISTDELIAAAPEVVLVQACGFDLERTRHAWQQATALRAALAEGGASGSGPTPRVVLCDGDAYFNRPGPRLVDSAELLGEVLHPQPGARGAAERRGSDPRYEEATLGD